MIHNYAAHKHPKVRAWLDSAPTLHLSLHTDLMLLAQRGGRVIRQTVEATIEARRLPIRRRASGRHQLLRRRDKPDAQAIYMDRRPKQNHRWRQTREPSVRFDPLVPAGRRKN